jgi:vacuolar-type H+-ATPase subunit E/Vma4
MENLKSQIKFTQEMESKEIFEDAEEQARKIIEEAKEKSVKIREQKMKEISEKIREKKTSQLAMTKMEGRQKISNVKSQLFEEAIAKSEAKIAEVVKTQKSQYKKNLERLIVEAATKLKGTEFEILVNSKDKKSVMENLEELEKKVSTAKGVSVSLQLGEEVLNSLGGVMVQTKGKRQIFNNTLEARLTKVRQEMASKIFETLFEGMEN